MAGPKLDPKKVGKFKMGWKSDEEEVAPPEEKDEKKKQGLREKFSSILDDLRDARPGRLKGKKKNSYGSEE